MNITPSPVPHPPPERAWKLLTSQVERDAHAADPTTEKLVVLCYNILCDKYAEKDFYEYTPSSALKWDYRKELIFTEVMNYDADILCMQEVDFGQYDDYFAKRLVGQDYEGVYGPKSRHVDGCATFFKKSKCV